MVSLSSLAVKKAKAYRSSSSFIFVTLSERIVKNRSDGMATQSPRTVVTKAWEIPPAIKFGSFVPDRLIDWNVRIIPDTVPRRPSNGDTTAMLNGLRDYLWDIEGPANIDYLIKDYFKENGYDFNEDEEEYDDDDDW